MRCLEFVATMAVREGADMLEGVQCGQFGGTGTVAFQRDSLRSDGIMAHWVSTSIGTRSGKALVEMPDDYQKHEGRNQSKSCRMFLIGPFALTDNAGNPLTPKSQKSRALLAMLALSLRGSRSRVWLRDKLWSDRSEDQASGSLRQALLEIRRSLGDCRDILAADNNTISLNMDRIELDIDSMSAQSEAASHQFSAEHFLEGIDIRDEEFEEWLTLERQAWQARFDEEQTERSPSPKEAVDRSEEKQSPLLPRTTGASASPGGQAQAGRAAAISKSGVGSRGGLPSKLVIAFETPQIVGESERGQTAAYEIESLLFRSLNDMFGIGVVDLSLGSGMVDPSTADAAQALMPLSMKLRLVFEGDQLLCQIAIRRTADNTLVWTGSEAVTRTPAENGNMTALHSMVWRTVDQIGNFLINHISDEQQRVESLSARAVNRIFALSRTDLDAAEQLLNEGVRTAPSASLYAWLAFLQTFRVGQRYDAAEGEIAEKAQAYASKAIEGGADNAVVLALVGHVHSYLFCEYDFAAGLFEKSIRLNPAMPLSWDLYAMLYCYAGQPEKGAAMSNWVGELGAFSQYKYYFDTTKCISAALAGNHRLAISAGEEALRARPGFNSILRYLVASHANAGELGEARRYLERLETVETDFSIQSLKDSRYPLLRTGGGSLLIDGLVKAGVRDR
jgi:DNA-binding SARP family transcriptional activator